MRHFIWICLVSFSLQATAAPTSNFYATPPSVEKALAISESLIGKPYQAFLLGEGPLDPITPRSLFRLDAFDCLTYVETVIALTYADSDASFEQHYKALKYHGTPQDFFHRNHFTHVQWNRYNQAQGYLQPYLPPHTQMPTETLHTPIDIPRWYTHLSTDPAAWRRLSGQALTPTTVARLQKAAAQSSPTISNLTYFPISALLSADGTMPHAIRSMLPQISVVEIVRKNWDTASRIGTALDISHIGLLLHQGDRVILRHASEIHQRVLDEPLENYLQQQRQQASFAGLYIQTLNLH